MSPSSSLVPHAVCWASAPGLIWTMVVTNLITFLCYLTICCTLLFLVRRTGRVIARDWAWFVTGFALFIVACGSTHLLEVITTWSPIFWVDAGANILTAVVSSIVAVSLIRRAGVIAFSINDYADRLAGSEKEKHRLEDCLLAARKLEDWSRMSAVVSHEISNPLEAIQNLLFLIRTSADVSPDIASLAATASEEASRVVTISRSTLDFFRHATAPETIDLLAAAESVRMLLGPVLQQKSLSLEIETKGNLTVEALAGETRQVLLNLIRNACEATPRSGAQVTLKLTGRANDVELVIADHGSGIDPTLLPSLFEFGRSTKGDEGNGLGLWTVKHILERHGGKVSVESRLGQGTTFTICWPRKCLVLDAGSLVLAGTA